MVVDALIHLAALAAGLLLARALVAFPLSALAALAGLALGDRR